MDLPVAAGIDEHRGIALAARARAFSGEAATQPTLREVEGQRQRQDEVVDQRMEPPLDPEVGREGEREDHRVRGDVAARVVADQQHRPLRGDPLQSAHVGAEVEGGEHPEAGQLLADVVGVAIVEVGSRDPGGDQVLDAVGGGQASHPLRDLTAQSHQTVAGRVPGFGPSSTCLAGPTPAGSADGVRGPPPRRSSRARPKPTTKIRAKEIPPTPR